MSIIEFLEKGTFDESLLFLFRIMMTLFEV